DSDDARRGDAVDVGCHTLQSTPIAQSSSCRHPDLLQNIAEHVLRAGDGQVADVEVARAGIHQGANRPCADIFRARALGELTREPFHGDGEEAGERVERAAVRAAVEEDAEEAGQLKPAPLGGLDESRNLLLVMMADYLCEIELGMEVLGGQVIDLPLGVRM